MNFFKSVFSDDPDPPMSESDHNPYSDPIVNQSSSDTGGDGGLWNFGGLIKTLATKSESVIETYKRDLQEFGTGLKKELEVAQGSLETVGHAIDEFGNTVMRGTAEIISHGKDLNLADDVESDSSDTNNSQYHLNSKRYNRFDAQVRTLQGDVSTYFGEPEDVDDYNKWKPRFNLEEKSDEIENLLKENGAMDAIYKRVVPSSIDHQNFWIRYFYRIHVLKQAEELRATLVKRAISREEEELSWDVDEEDEDEGKAIPEVVTLGNREMTVPALVTSKNRELGGDGKVAKGSSIVGEMSSIGAEANVASKVDLPTKMMESGGNNSEQKVVKEGNSVKEPQSEDSKVVNESEKKISDVEHSSKEADEESTSQKEDSKEKIHLEGEAGVRVEDPVLNSNDKLPAERNESSESSKDSDLSVISLQPSMPEEDLGWDEIEDLSSIDEKKVTHGSPDRVELRKRLSAAEAEDLSWDIEDD